MAWLIIGMILLIWVVIDLVSGTVWSYRRIKRNEEPGMYWLFTTLWAVLAISCLAPYLIWYI